MMIEIISYQSEWPEEYMQLARLVTNRVGSSISSIHHIGSTAVPGLAAKNVIDIQISVADLSTNSEADIQLDGFELVSGLSDHCPPGQNLSSEQLEKRYYRFAGRPAHIHVREIGRFNQRYALLCRDYLRNHQEAADAYQQIKRELAGRFQDDQDSYYAVKDPTFDLLMVGAEAWAKSTNWEQAESD